MNAGDPCRLCDMPLREILNRRGPTGVLACEHCDRPGPCSHECRRCIRAELKPKPNKT